MAIYLARRLVLMVPTLAAVSVMVFLIMRLLPGDVVTLMFQDLGYAASLAEMRARLGLDLPLHEQYVRWLGSVLRGDFGQSLWTQRTVLSVLAERLPVTLELGLLSILFAVVYGGVTGVVAAVYQDRWADMTLRTVAMVFLSLPSFWLGTLAIVVPSIWLGWSPSLQLVPFAASPLESLAQFLLPAAILGSHLGAPIMRMTRAMMLEVLRHDYVRTARAKGLDPRRVVLKHALRNAIIPSVTILGVQTSQAIAGSVVMETLFQLPGMGSLLVESVAHRDFPMFQSLVLFLALFVMAVSLLVDLTYFLIDPRTRAQAE
ncbi:MAG TPA: ABC transporter permease [Candidatus Binatia bacterium]|nr:ABC transporter permease [Candidatus Binatia bacterium]